jgi:hypothetical protein
MLDEEQKEQKPDAVVEETNDWGEEEELQVIQITTLETEAETPTIERPERPTTDSSTDAKDDTTKTNDSSTGEDTKKSSPLLTVAQGLISSALANPPLLLKGFLIARAWLYNKLYISAVFKLEDLAKKAKDLEYKKLTELTENGKAAIQEQIDFLKRYTDFMTAEKIEMQGLLKTNEMYDNILLDMLGKIRHTAIGRIAEKIPDAVIYAGAFGYFEFKTWWAMRAQTKKLAQYLETELEIHLSRGYTKPEPAEPLTKPDKNDEDTEQKTDK